MPDDESTTPDAPEPTTPEASDTGPGSPGSAQEPGGPPVEPTAGTPSVPGAAAGSEATPAAGTPPATGATATPGATAPSEPTTASEAPAVLSRKELREQRERSSRTKWYVLGAAAVLLIGSVVAAAVMAGSSSAAKKAAAPTTTTSSTVPPVVATCPLTGTPAPGGVVPARPALAAKIGNYTDDRPSSGLNQADVVFEEPVEGSYTRLVAVFQCQGAALVGDLRSAREPDVGILSQLSNPVFVHAGGISPVLSLLADAPLQDENVLNGGLESITLHPSGRYAPYDTFTDTAPVWALVPSRTTPPAPLFTFTPAPPPSAVAGSGQTVHVPFSTEADVTWTWNPATSSYLRSYTGVPDKLLDGSQTSASNVVVMTVPTFTGPWAENSEGGREVEVTATGTGPLVVLRDGMAITGTWTRSSLTQPATLTAADGSPITLHPGNTWEELAPVGIPVTTTAAAPPATTAPASTPAAPSATATTRPTTSTTRP